MPRRKTEAEFESAAFEAGEFEADDFEAASDDDTDPLSVAYPGDLEADCRAELTAVGQAFADREKQERLRKEKATDSEYWCCLCFQTREQAEAFALAVDAVVSDKYIDGRKVAKKFGIAMPDEGPPFGRAKIDPKWAKLAMEV